MTIEEFKEENPHLAHLEGNELWNAMEDYMGEQEFGPMDRKAKKDVPPPNEYPLANYRMHIENYN